MFVRSTLCYFLFVINVPKFLCNRIIFSKQCILVFSQELIDEFLDVSKRPKLRRFFSTSDIKSILETIEEYALFINIETKIETCRNPKYNFLLSLSVDGNADYLLTGDKDLLDLKQFFETTIIIISDFLKNN